MHTLNDYIMRYQQYFKLSVVVLKIHISVGMSEL